MKLSRNMSVVPAKEVMQIEKKIFFKFKNVVISTNKGVFLKGPERMIFLFVFLMGEKKDLRYEHLDQSWSGLCLYLKVLLYFYFHFVLVCMLTQPQGLLGARQQ